MQEVLAVHQHQKGARVRTLDVIDKMLASGVLRARDPQELRSEIVGAVAYDIMISAQRAGGQQHGDAAAVVNWLIREANMSPYAHVTVQLLEAMRPDPIGFITKYDTKKESK
jgi:hypothetical protein